MNLQETIRRILREELFDKKQNSQSDILTNFKNQDQEERNEYQKFVHSEFNGDYERAAKEYAKLKNRSFDDIFGDKERMEKFISIDFDFDGLSDEDWENYWLLSQHADTNPNFQKDALKTISQYLGKDNDNYKYLHDRISCRETGTQKYGTQNICKKYSLDNLQESIRRILRKDKDPTKLIKKIIDFSNIFEYEHFCGVDIINPEERTDQYNFLDKNNVPFLIKVYFIGGPNSKVWPRTQGIRDNELHLIDDLRSHIKSFVPFNIEMMDSHVNTCDGYDKLMKRKYSTDELQESIKRILREETELSTYFRRRMGCFEDFINKLDNGETDVPIIRGHRLNWNSYQIILTAYMRAHCGEENFYYDPEIHQEILNIYEDRLYKWYINAIEKL
jgi:hypothetical protein